MINLSQGDFFQGTQQSVIMYNSFKVIKRKCIST